MDEDDTSVDNNLNAEDEDEDELEEKDNMKKEM